MTDALRVAEAGWTARAALASTGGRARVLATLSGALYLAAAGEILWLGRVGDALHARALLVPRSPVDAAGSRLADGEIRLDTAAARVWAPPGPPPDRAPASRVRDGCRALRGAVATLGTPAGFGALLAGGRPAFPLDRAAGAALELARACAAGDADAAAGAALGLVGLGPGLTPSGDDYVGAAFFANAVLGDGADAGRWRRAAARIHRAARARSHPVSAALLGDLCRGSAHAPLHDLACALAAGDRPGAALDAARRLVRIGHSSGWDMLAGFVAGLAGLPDV